MADCSSPGAFNTARMLHCGFSPSATRPKQSLLSNCGRRLPDLPRKFYPAIHRNTTTRCHVFSCILYKRFKPSHIRKRKALSPCSPQYLKKQERIFTAMQGRWIWPVFNIISSREAGKQSCRCFPVIRMQTAAWVTQWKPIAGIQIPHPCTPQQRAASSVRLRIRMQRIRYKASFSKNTGKRLNASVNFF